jgi:hypothetical protein
MNLTQIERRSNISREEFLESYYFPKKPVVLTNLVENWPAVQKWTPEFLIQNYGHLDVPVIGPDFHKPGPNYMKSHLTMKFGDYLQLIQQGPTEYRIFAWNILSHAPEMVKDFSTPTICDGFFERLPMMFFGGAGAATPMHYDIDWPNNFHTHFWTRKHIVLFDQTQNQYLYQHPYTVQSHVNPLKPDFEKYPALKKATGVETILGHGETLFIPRLWWHYITYMEGGYSITLRSYDGLYAKARGVSNLLRHLVIDKGMNTFWGDNWKTWKETKAIQNAEEAMAAAHN